MAKVSARETEPRRWRSRCALRGYQKIVLQVLGRKLDVVYATVAHGSVAGLFFVRCRLPCLKMISDFMLIGNNININICQYVAARTVIACRSQTSTHS